MRSFNDVINMVIIFCNISNINVNEHFANVGKPIKGGNGNIQIVNDYKLTRYACYLIVQNGNPNKEVIALSQTYFAIRTRKLELNEEYFKSLDEDDANETNYEVGSIVRKIIKKLGGTMPEELPTPEKSINELNIERLK